MTDIPKFPTMLRKMWTGLEVQEWIDQSIKPSMEESDRGLTAFRAVLDYALGEGRTEDPLEFLRCWSEGNFDTLRKEWSDAPEEIYFADPLAARTPKAGDKTCTNGTLNTLPQQLDAANPVDTQTLVDGSRVQKGPDLSTKVASCLDKTSDEPWYGHRFKEVQRGIWKCACGTRFIAQPVSEPLAWIKPVSELLGHISDVLGDEDFKKIDTAKWNAVSALVGVATIATPPAPAPNALDAETAIKNCLETGEMMRVLKRVVNLLLESRRNLNPEDHELRDRIDQLFLHDAAIAAQAAQGAKS